MNGSWLSIQLGISWSQLTSTDSIIFQRGRLNHQWYQPCQSGPVTDAEISPGQLYSQKGGQALGKSMDPAFFTWEINVISYWGDRWMNYFQHYSSRFDFEFWLIKLYMLTGTVLTESSKSSHVYPSPSPQVQLRAVKLGWTPPEARIRGI